MIDLMELVEDQPFDLMEMEMPGKKRRRGERRKTDYAKANRKMRIASNFGYHAVLGYYRKGKVHCSCPMCSAKTGGHLNSSRGPVQQTFINPETHKPVKRHGTRLAVTNDRYGKKNYKPSDRRMVDRMNDELKEYLNDFSFNSIQDPYGLVFS